MSQEEDFFKLETAIGYSFRDRSLLKKALTHTSYANERKKSPESHLDSNQRLEFLGDSVLGITVSKYLYNNFPKMAEGKLSKLRAAVVCEGALAEAADKINLGRYILLGHGEKLTGGDRKPSILSDAVESVIAAVYLDSSMEQAEKLVMDGLGMREIIDNALNVFEVSDYKTVLQEKYPGYSVIYTEVSCTGPQHDRSFTVKAEVYNDSTVVFSSEGTGKSKKEAEQHAAKAILGL